MDIPEPESAIHLDFMRKDTSQRGHLCRRNTAAHDTPFILRVIASSSSRNLFRHGAKEFHQFKQLEPIQPNSTVQRMHVVHPGAVMQLCA